jgi:hypothetical protein
VLGGRPFFFAAVFKETPFLTSAMAFSRSSAEYTGTVEVKEEDEERKK